MAETRGDTRVGRLPYLGAAAATLELVAYLILSPQRRHPSWSPTLSPHRRHRSSRATCRRSGDARVGRLPYLVAAAATLELVAYLILALQRRHSSWSPTLSCRRSGDTRVGRPPCRRTGDIAVPVLRVAAAATPELVAHPVAAPATSQFPCYVSPQRRHRSYRSPCRRSGDKVGNGIEGEPFFQRGEHTLRVPMSLFAENRRRLVNRISGSGKLKETAGVFVVLQGGDEVPFNDTDVNWPFRQESFFQWCFGVEEPGCFGAIDVETGSSILFVPRLPQDYAIWQGKLHTLLDFTEKYVVNEAKYCDEIGDVLKSKRAKLLLTLSGENSDSGLKAKEAVFDGIEKFEVDNRILYPEICECRVIKTAGEVRVLEYVVKVSSEAHKSLMRQMKPGWAEFQAEAAFQHYCYHHGGCRHVSYTCICGSGHNSSVLHYGHAAAPNNKIIKDGDMCLFDMGANYCGYAADITCSYPANGRFTAEQKLVYNAVLAARDAVLREAKPNVSWTAMHLLANRVLLEQLKQGGLLKGDVEEMMDCGLNEVFQPHGLGHFMGLDVHDVGGYLEGHPQRSNGAGVRKLRTARVLKQGMVLTVEPGCYFIDCLLDSALGNPDQSKFIVEDELRRFRGFGGVRIEDDVLVTETGVRNLTDVPRTVEEIEKWMAGDN